MDVEERRKKQRDYMCEWRKNNPEIARAGDARRRQNEERKKYMKDWEAINREKRNIKQREYHQKHKEKRHIKQKEYYEKNKEAINKKNRNNQIKKEYGITIEEYNILLESQNYKCQICSNDISNGNQHLDHSHKTGRVRAFLCNKCNMGIGFLQDNSVVCKLAAAYLERYQ